MTLTSRSDKLPHKEIMLTETLPSQGSTSCVIVPLRCYYIGNRKNSTVNVQLHREHFTEKPLCQLGIPMSEGLSEKSPLIFAHAKILSIKIIFSIITIGKINKYIYTLMQRCTSAALVCPVGLDIRVRAPPASHSLSSHGPCQQQCHLPNETLPV